MNYGNFGMSLISSNMV